MKKSYAVKDNRITFLDNRFYLSESGVWQPSATTILDAYPKGFGFMEWLKKNGEDSDTIRDAAGERGSRVHNLTERYDNGEEVCLLDGNDNIAMRMDEWHMFEKYVEFRAKNDTVVLHNEVSLVSDKLAFGGTIDRVMTIDNKSYIVDIKTSNYLSTHFWLQLAAYRELFHDWLGFRTDGIAILHLNAKTRSEGKKGSIQGKGWQLLRCENEEDMAKYYRLFCATYALWSEENEGMKPREVSYQIKHKLIA